MKYKLKKAIALTMALTMLLSQNLLVFADNKLIENVEKTVVEEQQYTDTDKSDEDNSQDTNTDKSDEDKSFPFY